MSDTHYDKLCPAEFKQACLYAHGAIVGWCTGSGEDPPYLTDVRKEAYERAFASAFDAGYRAALAHEPAIEGTSVEWGIRVDEPHPRRKEKAGTVMTHFPEENVRRCREIWAGWTPVRRRVRRKAVGPWEEVSAE